MLRLIELTDDPQSLIDSYYIGGAAIGVALRVPGGLAAAAIRRGLHLQLSGPTAAWFVGLGAGVTGRIWQRVNADAAHALLDDGPAFVKLADAKHQLFPATRFLPPASSRLRSADWVQDGRSNCL